MDAFRGNFTLQEPIPGEAISAAVEVMRSGRLHRYNTEGNAPSEAALLEQEFAAYQGCRYALACASGGQAMQFALRAAGVEQKTPVLTNAFTLAPVPGAIAAVGAEPVFVEITEDLVIDLDDLSAKAEATGARFLLLSHMRGHLADMDALSVLAGRLGLTVIEDCAHTMGATWDGCKSGAFGLAGCFSTQTYKHINSGEGGLLTSDNPHFMARAIVLSGSYMLYERHGAAPDPTLFAQIRLDTPNMSARMDNLRAAILRPQLQTLDENVHRWNARYRAVEGGLSGVPGVVLPARPAKEMYVGSSIQFRLPGIGPTAARAMLDACKQRGVELKWFGDAEPVAFTSTHASWRFVSPQALPRTDKILSGLFDMRLPLTFSIDDCRQVATLIGKAVVDVRGTGTIGAGLMAKG